MSIDVNDLVGFYASPLGFFARRAIARVVNARWENCRGLCVMGLGFGAPYLERFRQEARCTLAFMPAAQGVTAWPAEGASASALVETDMLPLPENSMDRVFAIHVLEVDEDPNAMLEEIWRVLTPGGRFLLIVPSRRGVWARMDGTPFGFGRPYSMGQLRELLRETLFTPIFSGEALYAPPFRDRFFLNAMPALERFGAVTGFPFAGVHIVEATKQLYRPVTVRRVLRRQPLALSPALAPSARRDVAQ